MAAIRARLGKLKPLKCHAVQATGFGLELRPDLVRVGVDAADGRDVRSDRVEIGTKDVIDAVFAHFQASQTGRVDLREEYREAGAQRMDSA